MTTKTNLTGKDLAYVHYAAEMTDFLSVTTHEYQKVAKS